jgi:hypothetical protein
MRGRRLQAQGDLATGWLEDARSDGAWLIAGAGLRAAPPIWRKFGGDLA